MIDFLTDVADEAQKRNKCVDFYVEHKLPRNLVELNINARDPWTALGAQPLQHLEVPAMCGTGAYVRRPRAVLGARPLQHLEVPTPCGIGARISVPRAVR